MLRKLIAALALSMTLIALTMVIVSADPPKPGKKPEGKPTLVPGLEKTPLAEKEQGKDKGRHGVFGTVTAKGVKDFTVTTKQGDVILILVTANTRFQIPTKKDATFSELQVNDSVAVNGTPTSSGLEAKKVGIVPRKPSIQHRVGIVKAYAEGTSIMIEDTKGETATFQLTKDTEIRSPKDAGIKIGDRVTVVSRREPSTSVFTARAIVVHPN